MNRTIKFKYYSNYSDGTWALDYITLEEIEAGHFLGGTKHKVQFTGLLDKNGKEIYEGDIIKRDPDIVYGKDEFNPLVYVEWRYTAYCLIYKNESHSRLIADGDGETMEDMEVVGNIYENSDLLIKE